MSHVTHMNESCHTHECAESAMAGTRQEQFTFTLASTISNSYVHITHLSAPFFVVHFYTHFYNFKFVCDIHVTFKIREQFWYKLLISLGSSSSCSKDHEQNWYEKSKVKISLYTTLQHTVWIIGESFLSNDKRIVAKSCCHPGEGLWFRM